jgi:transposase
MTQQVTAMAFEGMGDVAIAETTNCSIETVRKMIARGRAHVIDPRREEMTRYGFLVKLSEPSIKALQAAAQARRMRPTELAELILFRVLEDGLTGAVMDDGV